MHRKNVFVSYLAALLVAATIASSHAVAQGSPTAKGSWIIAGSAGASSSHIDGVDESLTSISVSPTALYFFAPGVAFGGSATVGYVNTSSGSTTSVGIGPSIRYFFGDRASKTLPFVSATVAPTWTSTDFKNASPNRTGHNLLVEGTLGFTQILVPHVGITGEAFYDHASFTSDVGSSTVSQGSYSFGVRFGLTAFVY